MKKSIAIVLLVLALIAGGAAGYALHGSQASAPTASPSSPSIGTTNDAQSNPSYDSSSNSTPKCTTNTLILKIAGSKGGAAAGNRYYDLTATNSSSEDCTINGYPGVSLTDTSGTIVGSPADKDTSKAASEITLAPSASVTATIHLPVSENYPSGTCMSGATAIKVYPPNDTGSLSIGNSPITDWCPGFSTTVFTK